MAESRMTYNEVGYTGPLPTVLKKIDSTDVKVNPFQANKTWTVISGSSTSSVLPLTAIYSDTTNLPALGSELTLNDAANVDGSLQTITYFSVNHQYYKYKKYPALTFGPTDLNRTKKHLYQSASVFSFPQIRVGEGIKPGSFMLTGSYSVGSVYGTGTYGTASYGYTSPLYIHSDRYGNLYDSTFNTTAIISRSLMYYEGFNEYFDTSRTEYISSNVTYVPGINTSNGSMQSWGYAANFNGNGYIKTEIPGFYDRNNDYAISFFIRAENTGSDSNIIITKASSSLTPQYPFRISIDSSGYLEYFISANTGLNSAGFNPGLLITSAVPLDPVNYIHVVCQKSGSFMQLYTNGTLEYSMSNTLLIDTQSPFTASGRIDNKDPLFIGGFESGSNLTGTIDEIRIFNRALTATEIVYLSDRSEGGSFMQTNHVGNVFGKQGVAVISTPDYRYHGIINQPYTASYKSTVTIYELGVVANVDAGDFNMSTNLTLTDDSDVNYKSFVSSSTFAPYITTIGLYDDAGQLLAIGKLAQPIRKRSDVDMNFLVKIDLDRNIS
jgi:hypothetical protein